MTKPNRPRRLPSVQALLLRLIFVCLVPPALGAGLWLYTSHKSERAELKKDAIQAARAKVQTVDAELAKAEYFAQALATSESLNWQDFSAFHAQSLRLLRGSNIDLSVVLYDANGQQLVNTHVPYGQPLPSRTNLEQIQSVFATGRPAEQRLIFRRLDGRPVVATMVPVFSGKKVQYGLAVGFSTDRLNTILKQLGSDNGWVASIIDNTGTIAARTLNAETLIGQKSLPEILKSKQIDKKLENIVETHSQEGVPLFSAYSSSPDTGWGVVIDVPRKTLETPLWHSFMVFGLSATLILLLSISLAWLIGNRITKSVRALQSATIALGFNKMMDLPTESLLETDELSQALQASARILKRRTQQLQTANDNLQERSTELSEAQHIAKIGNWKWHTSTGAFFASDELLRLYGRKILLPFDAQKGTVFPEAAWQEIKTAAKATLQTKTGFSLLLPTLTAIGDHIWTRVNGELVCNATGDVTGLRGTMQDVDVHRKAELALQDSESRLSLALSNSDLALWEWNIKTDDLFFDDRWAAIQGDSVKKTPTNYKSFMQNVFLEDIPLIQAAIERYFRGESEKYEASYRVHHKDGPCIWIQASGKVVERDAAGIPLRMLGVAWDVTERKRNELEIAHLQNEMDDLLVWQVAQHTVAALAHEVNQPLASAAILCEAANRMLVTDGLSDVARADKSERLKQTLQRIASNIERAGEVLRNLLKSVNKPDITRAPAMVNELVAESVQTAIEEGLFDCRIITHYAADLQPVKLNRLQIVKVLLNLIHNAAQAMHGATVANGKIWISTALAADGREIFVSVRDEGPGISATLQQEVFQPFITTKSDGLGMGLTISRALIEANGGKLWHSQDDGIGATFHFTLPISS